VGNKKRKAEKDGPRDARFLILSQPMDGNISGTPQELPVYRYDWHLWRRNQVHLQNTDIS